MKTFFFFGVCHIIMELFRTLDSEWSEVVDQISRTNLQFLSNMKSCNLLGNFYLIYTFEQLRVKSLAQLPNSGSLIVQGFDLTSFRARLNHWATTTQRASVFDVQLLCSDGRIILRRSSEDFGPDGGRSSFPMRPSGFYIASKTP